LQASKQVICFYQSFFIVHFVVYAAAASLLALLFPAPAAFLTFGPLVYFVGLFVGIYNSPSPSSYSSYGVASSFL